MHIMEGFLPHPWWELWFAFSLPIVGYGIWRVEKLVKMNPRLMPMLAMAGAFIFVLSSLKMPSVTGSTSHPTGTGLSVVLFGPVVTSVLGIIVLLYQALLLAHGGISTLGANTASMGILGPLAGWLFYRTARKLGIGLKTNVFLTAVIADWVTYIVTSFQLALAFPATQGGVMASAKAFLAVFAITQVPIAIAEGILTVLIFKHIVNLRSELLQNMDLLKPNKTGVEG